MSREEAIETLKLLKPNMRFDDSGWLYTKQALEMAIQALSQEPTSEMVHVETLHQVMWERDIAIEQLHELGYEFGQKIEPCDDAVSREAVLKIIEPLQLMEWLKYKVLELPSVNPHETVTEFADRCRECGARYGKLLKQKSGKWIELPKAFDINENPCKCSACGHILSFMHGYPKSNYCPNCGAKMESEDKE